MQSPIHSHTFTRRGHTIKYLKYYACLKSIVGLKIYTTVVFPDRDGRICFPAIPWNLLPAHGQGTALLRRNEPVFGKNIIKNLRIEFQPAPKTGITG